MAALTSAAALEVRAPREGEGTAIAALWRELWDVHEGWGGYPAAHEAGIYEAVAQRIDSEARVRYGQPVLGRHIHLVAVQGGVPCGQVEGWFDRLGSAAGTPYTCEMRSLFVASSQRGGGTARRLLDELVVWAQRLARGAPVALSADVLEGNPALGFYRHLGFGVVSHGAMMPLGSVVAPEGLAVRRAEPSDALPLALLDQSLAARRWAQGDPRFDGPEGRVTPELLRALADYLGHAAEDGAVELVAVDAAGVVRASATFSSAALEPPFRPAVRAVLGRFAADGEHATAAVPALLAAGSRLAERRGAERLELTDLPPPGSRFRAAFGEVIRPWARVLCKPTLDPARRPLRPGTDGGSV